MGMEPRFYFYIAIKSFVIFVAWICSFKAIKQLPLSMYGVLDLSRVLFATLLGVTVMGEVMGPLNVIGLFLVGGGLLMLKFKPFASRGAQSEEQVSPVIVVIALVSCLLNAVSALMDKILTKDVSSAQLQFWYMLFLCIFYTVYALITRRQVNIKRALTNKWIWILSIMFVVADRALFVANSMQESKIMVMTLIKQAGCIVTILAGKFIFKEKNTGYKFVCAAVIILGIVLGTVSVV